MCFIDEALRKKGLLQEVNSDLHAVAENAIDFPSGISYDGKDQ